MAKDKPVTEPAEEPENMSLTDLFTDKEFFSADNERQNLEALEELDKALGVLASTVKEVTV